MLPASSLHELQREVRARAIVMQWTLDALTDDVDDGVREVIARASAWDGRATPLALAAAARRVELLRPGLRDEERAAAFAVAGAVALALLAMRSAGEVTEPLLRAPLEAAERALVACGWRRAEAAGMVSTWLAEAQQSDGRAEGGDEGAG